MGRLSLRRSDGKTDGETHPQSPGPCGSLWELSVAHAAYPRRGGPFGMGPTGPCQFSKSPKPETADGVGGGGRPRGQSHLGFLGDPLSQPTLGFVTPSSERGPESGWLLQYRPGPFQYPADPASRRVKGSGRPVAPAMAQGLWKTRALWLPAHPPPLVDRFLQRHSFSSRSSLGYPPQTSPALSPLLT